MRALFLVLLLANLAFFAWVRFFAPPEAGTDPRPMAQQINPEKLKIVDPAKIDSLPARPRPAPEPAPVACLEWGGFAPAEAPRAEQALAPLALGARLSQRRTDETAQWWVFIAPQGSRPAALKKAAELKSLGVDDYFVMQDDPQLRWAVSLGVFSTQDAANNRLEALKGKGVRSAQVGPREVPVQKVWFQVRGADAALQGRLKDVAAGIPGSELRDCPAN